MNEMPCRLKDTTAIVRNIR